MSSRFLRLFGHGKSKESITPSPSQDDHEELPKNMDKPEIAKLAFGYIESGNSKTAIELIKNNDLYSYTSKDGRTAYHYAASSGNLEVLKFLVGSQPGWVNLQDSLGWSPLHCACATKENFNEELLNYLLSLNNIKVSMQENAAGNQPIHYICRHQNVNEKLLDAFIAKGASATDKNRHGLTPLHQSALYGSKTGVALLLAKGAHPHVVDNNGDTPLHLAANSGNIECVTALLKAGADRSMKNREGKQPIDYVHKSNSAVYFMLTPVTTGGIATAQATSDDNPGRKNLKKTVIDPDDLENTLTLEDLVAKEDATKFNMPDVNDTWIIDSEEILLLKNPLGQGGMGKVYKGTYRHQEVAIKVMLNISDPENVGDLINEFKIMSQVRSEHIAYLYGIVLRPCVCIVMQYFKRKSLWHLLNDTSVKMSWQNFFDWARDCTQGLNFLHLTKPPIIHRDVKTLNYLVDENGKVKISDFGLSVVKKSNNDSELKQLDAFTPQYCAPELYQDPKSASLATDIYALGVVFWELVYRKVKSEYQLPYGEYPNLRTGISILLKVVKQKLRPTIPAKTPDILNQLIVKMWHQDPAERPQTGQILNALAQMQKAYRTNEAAWETLDDLSTAKMDLASILVDNTRRKGKDHMMQSTASLPQVPSTGTTPLNTGDGKSESEYSVSPLTTQKSEGRFLLWVDPNASHIYRPTVEIIEKMNGKSPDNEKITVKFFNNGEDIKTFLCSKEADKMTHHNTRVLLQRNIPADGDEAAGEAIYLSLKKAVNEQHRDLPLIIYGKNLDPLKHLHEPTKQVWVNGDDGFVFSMATFQPPLPPPAPPK